MLQNCSVLFFVVVDLYEDYGLENRLIMLEIEWPGAVMMLLKLGKLTPVTIYHKKNLNTETS